MKITKRQLRRIIKEDREGMTGFVNQIPPGVSLENAEYEQGYNDAIAGLPPDLEWEGRSYSERRDLDSYEAGYESGQEEMANEGLVRITKRQLKRIIKEERMKIVEQPLPEEQYETPEFTELVEAFQDVINTAAHQGHNDLDIKDAFQAALTYSGMSR